MITISRQIARQAAVTSSSSSISISRRGIKRAQVLLQSISSSSTSRNVCETPQEFVYSTYHYSSATRSSPLNATGLNYSRAKNSKSSDATARFLVIRQFSTASPRDSNDDAKKKEDKKEEEEGAKSSESRKGDEGGDKKVGNDSSGSSSSSDKKDESNTAQEEETGPTLSLFEKITGFIRQGINELSGADKQSVMSKQVVQAESYQAPKAKSDLDDEEDAEDKGPSAMVVVKNAKSPWENMKQRLQASNVYQEFMKQSRKVRQVVQETDVGKKAGEKVGIIQDKLNDVREIWETSQNPVIYFVSGAVSSITAPTEEAITITGFQRLDPSFSKEVFLKEAKEQLFPMLLKSFLLMDHKSLKPWCSELVYTKLTNDIKLRKQEGIAYDATILEIDELESVFLTLEDGTPTIKVTYGCQQINEIKNKDGETVEGGPNDVRTKFWVLLLQQEYKEETKVVQWKVVEFVLAGDLPVFV